MKIETSVLILKLKFGLKLQKIYKILQNI